MPRRQLKTHCEPATGKSDDTMTRRFLFFTKTYWEEPPRMRHQVARLLSNNGERVIFFEKPLSSLAAGERAGSPRRAEESIVTIKHRELVHHQLRFFPMIDPLNCIYTRRSILKSLPEIRADETLIIVNFNYDYYFLRDLFPTARIVTIINDDFIDNARLPWIHHIRSAMRATCRMSDVILTVSSYLQRQLRHWGRVEIFYPWSETGYVRPKQSSERDTLLFWGYINDRLDFDLLRNLVADSRKAGTPIHLRLVGPVAEGMHRRSDFKALLALEQVSLSPPTNLVDISFDRILAAVIPYRASRAGVKAMELTNKSIRLLSMGLPLLISGMPSFIRAPFINVMDRAQPAEAIEWCRQSFDRLQDDIRCFVRRHTSSARLKSLYEAAGVRSRATAHPDT